MTKPNTIPESITHKATLSAWLKCYPFMGKNPKAWGLGSVPISARCYDLYPDIVRALYPESRPLIVVLPTIQSAKKAIAA